MMYQADARKTVIEIMKSVAYRCGVAVLMVAVSACGGGSANSTSTTTSSTSTDSTSSGSTSTSSSAFKLSSSVGSTGGLLPADYSCDGTGSTIDLTWSGAPTATKEYAVLMTTLPGDGTTKWNWVLYSIPAGTTALAKNTFAIGSLGLGSDGPATAYNPPCSQGPGAKLYTYTVYALSGSPAIAVSSSQVTGAIITSAIAPLTLATATLNLSFTRTTNTGSSATCLNIINSLAASSTGHAAVSCDGTYGYVSSTGIPTHAMMNGITSSNLQVPIPQNFNGANGWKIPLAPAIAASPTSVTDGPIGIAINGVPIFNPSTQGGLGDTKSLGQLDTCNGHAGRADDYHYHAAPVCVMAGQPDSTYWNTHPIGWALDGFAIFGYNDASGTTAVRDSVCGGNTLSVSNAPGGYSYHLTNTYPYVLSCLIGTPSSDLVNQSSKYFPIRQAPVTPFTVSGMTLTTDATDGYQVLQFTAAMSFASTETGTDQYTNAAGSYQIRYKPVTGTAVTALLALPQNAGKTACWNFEFTTAAGSTTQPAISYCK